MHLDHDRRTSQTSEHHATTRSTQAPKVHIIEKAAFIGTPGPLTGEDLENERTARRLLAHLMDRERYRRWRAGEPEDPELRAGTQTMKFDDTGTREARQAQSPTR